MRQSNRIVPFEPDPVIDAYKPGIDMTLIRENLKLTMEQRLERLQSAVNAREELARQRSTLRPRPADQ